MKNQPRPYPRRLGKQIRERGIAAVSLVVLAPLFLACALAIKIESILFPDARGPILLRERRVAGGRAIDIVKFRTLDRQGLMNLPDTYIWTQENADRLSRVGRFLKRWYLDELPQLWNVLHGDIHLIGVRPKAVPVYEAEIAKGITHLVDMPGGLISNVVASKGKEIEPVELDEQYFEAYQTLSGWKLFLLDMRIIAKSIRMQLRHEGL